MSVRYRAARVGGTLSPQFVTGDDGCLRITSGEALGAYPARITDRLIHWASLFPERTFAAKRDLSGEWRRLSYRDALAQTRSIAEALLAKRLSADRPIVILSGNDLEHLLMSLGAMWAGVPYAPISTAYSLVSEDYGRLKHIFGVLTPGLVFASDGAAYGKALRAVATISIPTSTVRQAVPTDPALAIANRFGKLAEA